MEAKQSSIRAHVVADSITKSTRGKSRLTTVEARFPRIILAELNTHRVFARNSASSRAIPTWRRLLDVLDEPFVPAVFGKNRPGMQASEDMSQDDNQVARDTWLGGRDLAVMQAFALAGGEQEIRAGAKDKEKAESLVHRVLDLMKEYPSLYGRRFKPVSGGVHKQHANRILEPYSYHTAIITSTKWRNFYSLRASKMAQPEINELAIAMARAHLDSQAVELKSGEWHLPFIRPEDRLEISDPLGLARISSARCARVSYLTHDGRRSLDEDLKMATTLQGDGHMSPFEHPAQASFNTLWSGNFGPGWTQYRKMIENESDFSYLMNRDDFLPGMKGDEELVDFVLSLAA